MSATDPSTPSVAHQALADRWAMIRAIRDGAQSVRAGGQKYLPKYEAENQAEYDRRLKSAPWRPEFQDALMSIAAKPFGKEVRLAEEPPDEWQDLADDIDGRGNNLHTFAREIFDGGVSLGSHVILVDYPTMNPDATLAEEREANARPYWVSIPADSVLALRTERQGAREIVTHLRFRETVTVIDGFSEKTKDRIRVLEPTQWQVYERTAEAGEWMLAESGALTLGEVPCVLFCAGERIGAQYVAPPLLDLAEMQLELYRALSRQDEVLTYAGSPMLSAEGISPPDGNGIAVGPKTVLYAPGGIEGGNPKWTYVQPDASNIKEIRDHVASVIEDMRRLGMQPMLPKTGAVTATASGIEAAKAHTVVQAWAMGLKDALEQAFELTARWMNRQDAPSVDVHTDFAVGVYGAEEVRELREMRNARDISRAAMLSEMQRRGVLGPAFDPEEDAEALAEEAPALEDEADMAAAMPDGGAMPRQPGARGPNPQA